MTSRLEMDRKLLKHSYIIYDAFYSVEEGKKNLKDVLTLYNKTFPKNQIKEGKCKLNTTETEIEAFCLNICDKINNILVIKLERLCV